MKLKKIILVCLGMFLITGCDNMMNDSPTMAVESFFRKYQNADETILRQLDLMLDTKTEYSDDDKKDYKALMIKQYQNLSYKITEERQKGDTAVIETEVEVFDYKNSINKSNDYYSSHKDEFKDKSLISYQLSKMKDVEEKVIYQITFNLTRDKDGKWKIDEMNDDEKQKIHGLY